MTTPINLEKWKIKLPTFPPGEVLDNSTLSEYAQCPRRALYRYGMRRGFGGVSYALQFGTAYHKYRETVERLMEERHCSMNDEIHFTGYNEASKGWEDPPLGHKKEFLNLTRLTKAINAARGRIEGEQKTGNVKVTRSEDSFDLPLPFNQCLNCGYAFIHSVPPAILTGLEELDNECSKCGEKGSIYTPRHGGRVDQFIFFNNGDYVRDFKTTAYKGDNYDKKFDPNSQIQGYVWAGHQLSGRRFKGAMLETVYNTKTQGPLISQTYVDFSPGQQEQWIGSVMMERQMIQTMWSRKDELGYLAFPQRTNQCTQFGVCGFREACRGGSAFEIEAWLKASTVESHWDFAAGSGEEE